MRASIILIAFIFISCVQETPSPTSDAVSVDDSEVRIVVGHPPSSEGNTGSGDESNPIQIPTEWINTANGPGTSSNWINYSCLVAEGKAPLSSDKSETGDTVWIKFQNIMTRNRVLIPINMNTLAMFPSRLAGEICNRDPSTSSDYRIDIDGLGGLLGPPQSMTYQGKTFNVPSKVKVLLRSNIDNTAVVQDFLDLVR